MFGSLRDPPEAGHLWFDIAFPCYANRKPDLGFTRPDKKVSPATEWRHSQENQDLMWIAGEKIVQWDLDNRCKSV